MRWGQPVVSTAITELTPEGPRYRGHPALELARAGLPFENVAELLWSGVLDAEPVQWKHEPLPEGIDRALDALALQRRGLPMLRIYALATTVLGAAEGANSEIHRGTTIPAARQLVLTLAGCLGYVAGSPGFRPPRPGAQLAAEAARVLAPDAGERAADAINAALVLCADHELSSSTFAARVAASTGAELRACVLAAIGAHSGALLGGGCDRAEDLLRGAATTTELRGRIAATEAAGSRVPGFNLVVYPRGDPRARYLLELAREHAPHSPRARLIVEFIDEAEHRLHLRPSIEMGLVALSAALDLPERSAGALWALGRTAGWIAHVMEQRLAGYLLRPRARYVGAA